MISEGSKASGNAFKKETNGNWPILGKRGRVNGLNSFKMNTKRIKRKEHEEGRWGVRSPWTIQSYPMKIVA